MFCEHCGNKVSEKYKFCAECGHLVVLENDSVPSSNRTPTHSSEEVEQTYYHLLLIEQAKKTANIEMAKGIGWAILGLVITFITYTMASDGETYFVFWGLVIYGAYVFLRGLCWRILPKSLLKKALETKSEDTNSNKDQEN